MIYFYHDELLCEECADYIFQTDPKPDDTPEVFFAPIQHGERCSDCGRLFTILEV